MEYLERAYDEADALPGLLERLSADDEVISPRGATITSWQQAERVLAGFPDGRADEGPAGGPASLLGLGIAREKGWNAPDPASLPPAQDSEEDK